MKKNIVLLLFVFLIFTGCTQKKIVSKLEGENNQENVKKEEVKKGGIAEVCNYFPKELVEAAIGKPIVKVEISILGSEYCNYYTAYNEAYNHTPYGDTPGGPQIVVVYDAEDFVKDKAYNENHGTKYETDPSIGMDNYVMRNNVNKIWQTALALGGDKYLRIKFIDDAVTGEDLVKIAVKFAEKIQSGK